MEILLWLVPAALVTVVAMLWVAWWGREGRGAVDRETAARRMGEALSRQRAHRPGYAARRPATERSTGVAVRRTRPVVVPRTDDGQPPTKASGTEQPDRRAS